jgi:hypothetical protein
VLGLVVVIDYMLAGGIDIDRNVFNHRYRLCGAAV